jgi:hypothetical protein
MMMASIDYTHVCADDASSAVSVESAFQLYSKKGAAPST